jgi:hypothetical protein
MKRFITVLLWRVLDRSLFRRNYKHVTSHTPRKV